MTKTLIVVLLFFCSSLGLSAQQKKDSIPQKQNRGYSVMINGLSGEMVTLKLEELLKLDKLTCSVIDYEIISFGLVVYINGSYNSYSYLGNSFSQAKPIYKGSKPGQKILIENVKAKTPEGKTMSIKGIVIKIE